MKNIYDRGRSCRARIESFPENIDDVQPVILSRPSGYHPTKKPVISLTYEISNSSLISSTYRRLRVRIDVIHSSKGFRHILGSGQPLYVMESPKAKRME
jgi:hypothetical protein